MYGGKGMMGRTAGASVIPFGNRIDERSVCVLAVRFVDCGYHMSVPGLKPFILSGRDGAQSCFKPKTERTE